MYNFVEQHLQHLSNKIYLPTKFYSDVFKKTKMLKQNEKYKKVVVVVAETMLMLKVF